MKKVLDDLTERALHPGAFLRIDFLPAAKMTQAELARRLQSSQPRVAKAERGDRSVSMDLLVRALLATGATPREIAKEIARA